MAKWLVSSAVITHLDVNLDGNTQTLTQKGGVKISKQIRKKEIPGRPNLLSANKA